MTAVDITTGEVLDLMGEDEARLLVGRVNRAAVDMVNSIERIWRGRGWLALGYESWDDLCESEFCDMPRLGREQRSELVRSLRSLGMSTRAIGAAAGTSDATVRRDLAGATSDAPAEPVIGRDGKTYQPTQPAKTTVTERVTETRQTVTEDLPDESARAALPPVDEESVDREQAHPVDPATGSDDAETINRAFRSSVDPAADYRKRFTDALTRAHDVTQFDAGRAIATGGESVATNRHLVKSLADWCDAYLKATRPTHLRSAK